MARMRYLKLEDIPRLQGLKRPPQCSDVSVRGPFSFQDLVAAQPSNPEAQPIPFRVRSQHIDQGVDQPLPDLRIRAHSLVPSPSHMVPRKYRVRNILWTLSGYVIDDQPDRVVAGLHVCSFAVVGLAQARDTNRVSLWHVMELYPLHLKPSEVGIVKSRQAALAP